MGSGAEVVQQAVSYLNAAGQKTGVLKACNAMAMAPWKCCDNSCIAEWSAALT